MNADLDSVRRALQNDIYGLVIVLTIAVQDGVGYSLANSHIDTESGVVTQTASAYEFSDRGGRSGNRFDSAGQT